VFGSLIHHKKVINILYQDLPCGKNINNDIWNTPGEVLQWYICALVEFHIFLSHINTTNIFGVIARDYIFSSDAKKCQQAFLAPLLGNVARQSKEY